MNGARRPVTLAVEDELATLTLARPEAGNAMDWALIDALADAATEIANDASVRAVLLRGEGRNFSVGGDIKVFASEPDPVGYIDRLARRLHVAVEALAGMAAPVVVAVQGAAAGAGLSLVAGGDLVIAGAGSSYGMAYGAIGLRRAQEMAFTNRRLTAAEAERYGLVTRVVDDAALQDDALAAARAIANGPTAAYGRVKRLLGRGFAADLAGHLDAEATAIAEAMATADARGAIAAFLSRQTPVFEGR